MTTEHSEHHRLNSRTLRALIMIATKYTQTVSQSVSNEPLS